MSRRSLVDVENNKGSLLISVPFALPAPIMTIPLPTRLALPAPVEELILPALQPLHANQPVRVLIERSQAA